MYKSLIFVLFLVPFQILGQQTISSLDQIAYPLANPDWIRFRPGIEVTADELADRYKSLFGISAEDDLRLQGSQSDAVGMKHFTYQQYHQGYPVEGAVWIIHTRDGVPLTANGKLMRGVKGQQSPALTESQALQAAIGYLPDGARPLWTLTEGETHRLKAGLSEAGDYVPEGQLLWAKASADNRFDADQYTIAWRFKLYTDDVADDRTVYVSALDGTLIRSVYPHPSCNLEIGQQASHLEVAHQAAATSAVACGVDAQTTYYGMVDDFGTVHQSGVYYLIDPCGSNQPLVYTIDFNASAIVQQATDDWTMPNDSIKSHITAHWAGRKATEYYSDVFDRNSFDDAGTIVYILNDEPGSNAAWGNYMINGVDAISLGNSNTSDPDDDFGTVDVVGHEFTHGVTEATADLVYELEPGALNESISDILGTATEWHTAGITHDWLIASDRDAAPVRSMSNPNAYNDPDTYDGNFWVNLSGCTPGSGNDHCGVHTNSGVMNYWFYLVSDGCSGTNDNGDAYTVSGIGIDDAQQIVYRALTTYLTSMSQYVDAREATIQSAIDLFGCNSDAVEAVVRAWFAVGVGAEPVFDLTITSFDATSYEAISSIDVQATTWNVSSTVLEAGYEIIFTPDTDLTNNTDAVIVEDCLEVLPLQSGIVEPELDGREATTATIKG